MSSPLHWPPSAPSILQRYIRSKSHKSRPPASLCTQSPVSSLRNPRSSWLDTNNSLSSTRSPHASKNLQRNSSRTKKTLPNSLRRADESQTRTLTTCWQTGCTRSEAGRPPRLTTRGGASKFCRLVGISDRVWPGWTRRAGARWHIGRRKRWRSCTGLLSWTNRRW